MIPPPFQPYMPRSDPEAFRLAESVAAYLNRPRELCVAVPCEDALLIGRPQFGLSPADLIGGQNAVRVAGAVDAAALSNTSIPVNSIKAVPFIWDNGFPIATLGCNVTTGVATSKARVGVYDCEDDLGGNFAPRNLIIGSAALDCSTTGMKTSSSMTAQLEPGHVYFAAFLAYTAAATVNTIPVAGVNCIIESNAGAFTTHLSVAYTLASGTVGLPPVFPAGSVVQTSVPPAVFLTPKRASQHVATIVRTGHSPYLDGLTLRRVRLSKNAATSRATVNPSVKVRALVSNAKGSREVGSFDSLLYALAANTPRLISSSADIDIPLPAGCVLQAEVTQRGWPKPSMRDATVFFDLALS